MLTRFLRNAAGPSYFSFIRYLLTELMMYLFQLADMQSFPCPVHMHLYRLKFLSRERPFITVHLIYARNRQVFDHVARL
jgi:hypothetical protein